ILPRFRFFSQLVEKKTALKRDFSLAFKVSLGLINRFCFVESRGSTRLIDLARVKSSHSQKSGAISSGTRGRLHVVLDRFFDLIVFLVSATEVDVNLRII